MGCSAECAGSAEGGGGKPPWSSDRFFDLHLARRKGTADLIAARIPPGQGKGQRPHATGTRITINRRIRVSVLGLVEKGLLGLVEKGLLGLVEKGLLGLVEWGW